ncbi:putative motility protein [Bradyrhizobium sp. UFLA05-109]
MDMMAMVSSMLTAQQGALQSNIATTVMKQNMDAEKSAVLTLLGAGQPSLANVGAGVGNNLNITA